MQHERNGGHTKGKLSKGQNRKAAALATIRRRAYMRRYRLALLARNKGADDE